MHLNVFSPSVEDGVLRNSAICLCMWRQPLLDTQPLCLTTQLSVASCWSTRSQCSQERTWTKRLTYYHQRFRPIRHSCSRLAVRQHQSNIAASCPLCRWHTWVCYAHSEDAPQSVAVMKTYILPYRDLNPQPLGLCVTPLTIRITHMIYNNNNYITSYDKIFRVF